jgi:adenylate cyclase
MPAELRETEALIVFLDISRFLSAVRRTSELEASQKLNEFYRQIATATKRARGTVVKYLGDGALLFFEGELADAAVVAMLQLKDDVDQWLAALGWDCRLKVQAHYGAVVAGTFDDGERTFFDVLGAPVNTAATLESNGVTLTAQAFRQLTPATRTQFKKHTPPITYIHVDDSHARLKAAR